MAPTNNWRLVSVLAILCTMCNEFVVGQQQQQQQQQMPIDLQQQQVNVRSMQLGDGTSMLSTSDTNYAIQSPLLATQSVRAVSVNGEQVKLVSLDNRIVDTSVSSLSVGQREAITQVRALLAQTFAFGPWGSSQVQVSQNSPTGASAQVFTGAGSSSSSSNGGNGGNSNANAFNFNDNGRSISGTDSTHFSLARANLPYNWARIFVDNDMIGTVTTNGVVEWRPLTSMSDTEQQQVRALTIEVEQARQQFEQSMQQFSMGMQQFGQNLHHTLQQTIAPFSSGPSSSYYPLNYGDNYQADQSYQVPSYNYNNQQQDYQGYALPQYQQQYRAPFGNDFPFGPNNSPFGSGFPFNNNNNNNYSPFGAGFPFNG